MLQSNVTSSGTTVNMFFLWVCIFVLLLLLLVWFLFRFFVFVFLGGFDRGVGSFLVSYIPGFLICLLCVSLFLT